MRSGAAAVVAAVIASSCVMVDDQLQVNLLGACRLPDGSVGVVLSDGGIDDSSLDAGFGGVLPDCGPQQPVGTGGGGGGGGDGSVDHGDGGVDYGDGSVADPVPAPVPGSGKDGDNGTAVLVMLRVDQGTANIATNLQDLLKRITDALQNQGLAVRSVAVAEMYAIERIWASRVGQKSPPALASVLRAVSASRTAAAPTNCTTAALGNQGANALSWNQNEVTPFLPIPAAVLVVLIDPGARPHPLGDCVTSTFSADPVYWIPLQRKFRLGQTRFLMIATPENGDAAAMRAHCLAVPNFPTTGLDVLAPSSQPFFDPWSASMNAIQEGLATRVDLCDALGSGAAPTWDAMAKQWYQTLETLR